MATPSTQDNHEAVSYFVGQRESIFRMFVRPWAPLWSSEQIISSFHVEAGENRGHDSDYALAAFVHGPECTCFVLYSPSTLASPVSKVHLSSHYNTHSKQLM
jgi:hypothetical protein